MKRRERAVSTDRPGLADRVMRARKESMCGLCFWPVKPGQQIAKFAGEWVHSLCAIERRESWAAAGLTARIDAALGLHRSDRHRRCCQPWPCPTSLALSGQDDDQPGKEQPT